MSVVTEGGGVTRGARRPGRPAAGQCILTNCHGRAGAPLGRVSIARHPLSPCMGRPRRVGSTIDGRAASAGALLISPRPWPAGRRADRGDALGPVMVTTLYIPTPGSYRNVLCSGMWLRARPKTERVHRQLAEIFHIERPGPARPGPTRP